MASKQTTNIIYLRAAFDKSLVSVVDIAFVAHMVSIGSTCPSVSVFLATSGAFAAGTAVFAEPFAWDADASVSPWDSKPDCQWQKQDKDEPACLLGEMQRRRRPRPIDRHRTASDTQNVHSRDNQELQLDGGGVPPRAAGY